MHIPYQEELMLLLLQGATNDKLPTRCGGANTYKPCVKWALQNYCATIVQDPCVETWGPSPFQGGSCIGGNYAPISHIKFMHHILGTNVH